MDTAAAELGPQDRWFDPSTILKWARDLAPAHLWPDAVRMTIAAVAAFLASNALHLSGIWVVLTSLLVARRSANGGMRTVIDRLAGVALGLGMGFALVAMRRWHVPDALLIALATLPLCMLVLRFRKFQAAPISAILVLSTGAALGSALHFALARLGEISLGAAIGLAVGALVLRQSGDQLSRESAARVLTTCDSLLAKVAAGEGSPARHTVLRDRMRADLHQMMATRRALPLPRTDDTPAPTQILAAHLIALARLQHDVTFFGRVLMDARRPWRLQARPALLTLADAFVNLCAGFADYVQDAAPPPSFTAFDMAVAGLRRISLDDPLDEACLAVPFVLARLRADLASLAPSQDARPGTQFLAVQFSRRPAAPSSAAET